ncbi:hypothetical protein JCM16816_04700 [Thermoanaerobacter brockii subsp. lactiethylicus]
MLYLRKLKKEDKEDIEFYINCIKDDRYITFINPRNRILSNYKNEHVYIIEVGNEKYGIVEFHDWDKINNNVSVNIFMLKPASFVGGKALLESAYLAIEIFKFHKILIKVLDTNKKMLQILKKLNIKREGIIKNGILLGGRKFCNVHIFGLLENEYYEIKEKLV